jgi:hypothetical protein
MNWGYKILVVYLVFVAGIAVLVIKSSDQKIDLVTEDYYGKELQYQQRIDEIARAKSLTAQPEYLTGKSGIEIRLPADFSGKKITGSAVLYCPADETRDRTLNISQEGNASLLIPLRQNDRGSYTVQLTISCDGRQYYFEHQIFI